MADNNRFKKAADKARVAPGRDKETETPTVANPLAGMIEQKLEGKSYGFYLSTEAAEKLETLARQNKCSKSKALDTLLRNL